MQGVIHDDPAAMIAQLRALVQMASKSVPVHLQDALPISPTSAGHETPSAPPRAPKCPRLAWQPRYKHRSLEAS